MINLKEVEKIAINLGPEFCTQILILCSELRRCIETLQDSAADSGSPHAYKAGARLAELKKKVEL